MIENKKIIAKIKSSSKEYDGKSIVYKSVKVDFNKLDDVACDYCPYNDICEYLVDPRDPKNTNKNFIEFCGDVEKNQRLKDVEDSEDVCEDVIMYVPKEGELEKLFINNNIFKQTLEKNPLIKLNDVIDCVCENWCDQYNKEHSNCSPDNYLCILKKIFLARK